MLFAQLAEVDPLLIWGDSISLNVFLDALRRFVRRCPAFPVPAFASRIPILVLRGIIAMLSGEWDECVPHCARYNELLQNVKSFSHLLALIGSQSLISLLEIRDRAAACAAVIHAQTGLYNRKTLDLLGKRLIHWPSRKIWRLITVSGKTLASTTNGLLSLDARIALAAASRCPEKFQPVMVNGDVRLTSFAISGGFDVDFTLSVELVRTVDKYADSLSEPFVAKLAGSWMIICLSRHRAHDLVKAFFAVPFGQWAGPPQFWKLLPKFLFDMAVYLGWKATFDPQTCDDFHRFFAYRNIRYFIHEPFADYGEIQLTSAQPAESPIVSLRPLEYYEPEVLRAMRCTLYRRLGCRTFSEMITVARRAVKRSNQLFASVSNFVISPDCDIDAYADGLLFSLELFLVEKPQVPQFPLAPLLAHAPFRAVGAQFAAFLDRTANPLQFVSGDQICLESEMNGILPILMRTGQRISFPVPPLSPLSLEITAGISPPSFALCLRSNLVPPFQAGHQDDLVKQVTQFGISCFALDAIEKWLCGSDSLRALNSVLSYAAAHGTYYVQRLTVVLRSAMARYPAVVPVVEAVLLTLEDTPLRKALDMEFRAIDERRNHA